MHAYHYSGISSQHATPLIGTKESDTKGSRRKTKTNRYNNSSSNNSDSDSSPYIHTHTMDITDEFFDMIYHVSGDQSSSNPLQYWRTYRSYIGSAERESPFIASARAIVSVCEFI